MGDCPSKECRQRLEDTHKYVFGNGSGNDIMNKVVLKSTVWRFISIFGVIMLLGVFGIYSLSTQNRERVRVLESQGATIKEQLGAIKGLLETSINVAEKAREAIRTESKEAGEALHERITRECIKP